MADALLTFNPALPRVQREALRDDLELLDDLPPESCKSVLRGGVTIDAQPVIHLLSEAATGTVDVASLDGALAPWVHSSLRLTRAEAADPALWEYLAVVQCQSYVRGRWKDAEGGVAGNRWRGPIHKQAVARLWWGAELLRDGSNYDRVTQFFEFQDFPNSYLHRRFMRARPMALGLMAAVEEARALRGNLTSREVNDVARTVNLRTAGTSIATLSLGYAPSVDKYRQWTETPVETPDLTRQPLGPDDGVVPDSCLLATTAQARRMCADAGL